MITGLMLIALLSVMVLVAACGGGEAPTTDAPTPVNEADLAEALAHSNAGVALQGEGNLKEAIAEYDEAIRLDPQLARLTATGPVHM